MENKKETMKAVIFIGDKQLETKDVPIPKPGAMQVQVKIEAAAICGSDMHFYMTKKENFTHQGTISGHEPAGIVSEVGQGVTNVKIGDRVTLYHFHGCGACELCYKGHYNNCRSRSGLGWEIDGSNAEYIVMNAENCFIIPPELSMEDGTIIACIGSTAYSALKKLNVSGRDLLVIYGLGALGLAATVIAKGMGATVIGVERNAYRLSLAKSLGIDYLVDTVREDACEKIMRISGGHGADKSLETSGANPLRKIAAKAAAIHGSVALLGFDDDVRNEDVECLTTFDTRDVIRKELNIMGSYVIPLGMYSEMLRFLSYKKIKLDRIVTHRFPLTEYMSAIDVFLGGNAGKIIITP